MNGRGWFAVALIFVAGGVFAFFKLSEYASRGGEEAPLYSVFRADPYGSAALKDLLEETGTKTNILLEPTLPEGDGQVLIQILANEDLYRRNRILSGDLATWVSSGNTLFVLCRGNSSAGVKFGIKIDRKRILGWIKKMESSQRAGRPPGKLTGKSRVAKLENAEGWAKKSLVLHEPVELTWGDIGVDALAKTKQGTVAAQREFGDGKVVIVGDPSPVLNGWIEKGANMEFILSVVGSSPVWFDEWSHGMGRGGSIIGVIERFGLIPALLQMIFFLALYLWSGRGTAAPERAPEREKVSVVEQVDTLGRLYSKTMKPDQVRQRVSAELMTRAHNCVEEKAHDMETAMKKVPASVKERLEKVLSRADELIKPGTKAGKKELVDALNMSSDLTKEKKEWMTR